ncbi:MAG: UDP-N-acetylmuramoyl-L-alanyl-D-glutamate--2,6-diaminopimelate ligase [Deltaproteobacteria bacterium]|nr:MAG: UDP-N-acetylmuramoyl-L-alanyl-D-glutamate--2,6-diaminopimelate ligase [Deltaproteobacteria bacterium]
MSEQIEHKTCITAVLLSGVEYSLVCGILPDDLPVTAVSSDSRKCRPGSMFAALVGSSLDGHDYILQAAEAGASLIMVQKGRVKAANLDGLTVPVIEVEDSRAAYAVVAANMYGNPARELTLVGITGTNGKTTVTCLLEEIFTGLGHAAGVIGTVSYRWLDKNGGQHRKDAARTTPDAVEMQAILREMADDGVEYVFVEVSSHALDQKRVAGLEFSVAAFTNLSHDHLDYHGDLQDYFAAKALLFGSYLKKDGTAVIYISDETDSWADKMAEYCRSLGLRTITAGTGVSCEIRLTAGEFDLYGSRVSFETCGREIDFRSPLPGMFNIENMLTALAVITALEVPIEKAVRFLAGAAGAPGRLQRIEVVDKNLNIPEVFVDYAHTPDALEKVLRVLGELPHKNLVCVFGCGGERDRSKRPVMGKVAAELATVSVLTSDNPRNEEPEAILEQIVSGVLQAGREIKPVDWLLNRAEGEPGCIIVQDRAEAVRAAVSSAARGDVVLIAGKGHEKYQVLNCRVRFFDDCLEAEKAMLSWNGELLEKALSSPVEGRVTRWWSGRIETDSRKVQSGDVFIALKGDNFDGHDYMAEAEKHGAAALIISNPELVPADAEIPRIVVDDTLAALGRLAAFRRQLVKSVKDVKIAGITGSCGKTTVKEMTAAILEQHWPVNKKTPAERILKTKGNFNNLIGVPLSVLPLCPGHEAAVFELGMNRSGEISKLAAIIDPDVSCITNIHAAHLEELGDISGVARAKMELFDWTSPDNALVINLDDQQVAARAGAYPHRQVTFSMDPGKDADFKALNPAIGADGCFSFILKYAGEEVEVFLNVPGYHSISNALAAAAISGTLGASPAEIAAGLESFRPIEKRMNLSRLNGLNLINDAYNANPESMRAGVETLMSMKSGKKMAVLGDMLELGSSAESAHLELGRMLGGAKLDYLALYGDLSRHTMQGAMEAGLGQVRHFEQKQAIADWLAELQNNGCLPSGSWVLIKGSRGMKMEEVLNGLGAK